MIENVQVVDASGSPPRLGTVLVDRGEILEVRAPDAAEGVEAVARIDGTGKTLIPGLWDVHVHLEAERPQEEALQALLSWGVTTVRDMGAVMDRLPGWRAEIEAGTRRGPRLFYAGSTINGPPMFDDGPWHRFVLIPEEARAAVRDQVELGADLIKIHRQLGPASFHAVLDEAKAHGKPVVGHIPYGVTPLEACEAGQAEIAHVVAIVEAILNRTQPPPPSLPGALEELRGQEGQEFRDCLAERGTYVSPNLAMYLPFIEEMEDPERQAMTRRLLAVLQEGVGVLYEAGVTLLVGSDAPAGGIAFGSSVHDELELLVEAGVPPIEALRAATVNPARFHGLEGDVGTIAPGQRADLVLLAADPLEDISHSRKIEAVFQAGVQVHPAAEPSER